MLALEGRQLGNYDVIKRIRVGGMGAVYEGRQRTAFDRRVAIKVILGNYAADRDMRRRFAREARTIARLHHPHILPLIEFGDEQGMLYLVMPFIDGGTLTSYLRRGRPDLNEVTAIYQQLLDAVEYAHDEGLIHRDIKSSNVLLEMRRSGHPYAYLADFGLVRTSRQAEIEQAGKPIPLDQVPGTPHYMAPEQTQGIVTTSSDIYALGVLLYQMLAGELPYDDPDEVEVIQMHLHAPIPSLCELNGSLPAGLDEVIRTAMAKRAEDRFRNIAELRAAFLAAISGAVAPVDEDELLVDDVLTPPGRSIPLIPQEPLEPMPIPLQARYQRVATEVALQNKQRTTDSVKDRQRITGPVITRHRRFTWSIVVATLVPIILLILLIMPRLLGISLFPVGFPVFGTNPVTTVSVTPQSKMLQDTYLLAASPQTQSPNLTTHIIPDRIVSATSTDSRSTQTTGTSAISAVQATGTVFFANSSPFPISVPAEITFTTTSGIQVTITSSVNVPRQQDRQSGSASAPAMAVNAGASGNIAANTLATNCCNGLFVSNPNPFGGGSDARVVHMVAQVDLDRVSSILRSGLQQHVLQDLQKQLRPNEVMAGQPMYSMLLTPDSPIGTLVDQVQVRVSMSATVSVYNSETLHHVAAQLLSTQALQTLGSNYQLQGTPSIETPRLVQTGKNGSVYLSVVVHGLWVYYFSPQQLNMWKQFIKGAPSVVALAYLNSRMGVAAVQIHLPFGTDQLPTSPDQIHIVFVNK